MFGQLATLWTIRLSLACYACVLIALLTEPTEPTDGVDDESEEAPGPNRLGPFTLPQWWAISCGLFLIHVGLAFHYYHHWSHARAFEHTAAETQRLLGVRFGYGVYVNHLFAIVWTMDGALWLLAPQLHARRSRWLHRIVHGFLFFIAFNGAVIFEDGPVRWFGIFVTLLIAGLWLRRQLLVSTRVNSSPTMDAS